jgi:DNA-binding IclR family transcriptional regulator
MTKPVPVPTPSRTPQRGIQSIEVGGALLRALAHHGRALPLKELAAEAGMAPAKAHPYLVSFGKLGLIEREEGSGRYGLGPLAMQLGLISLQQSDPVALATPLIEPLAEALGHTVAVAVWGNRGPTIVRIAQPPQPVHVSMRHGTVMSLSGTASGRLFAAWLPAATLAAARRAEKRAGVFAPASAEELAQIRRAGFSAVRDLTLPGISALAAPVFDSPGALALSLTAIGPTPGFDVRAAGAVARPLLEAAQALSARLGSEGPARR